MSDLAKAYVQIIPSAKGMGNAIADEIDPAAQSAGSSAGSKIGSLIKGAILAAGIGTALKSAISEGMELEQNLGGTEAVFGEYAHSIQTSAQEAYKNMGMSASDYMATANKMGSLFQGSGLEQQRALDLTSKAMQRAADVASVMGLDMDAAMESIAGAAKGNFTMMDNLGVAMNATTLQAYALEKGINFDWNTADNAAKAELAMQMFFERTEQYAGNFARESAQTLSGSLGAVQSALKNVMGNLALGNDIKPSLNALKETAVIFFRDNLLPTITNVLSVLPSTALSMVVELGPEMIRHGMDAVKNIAAGFAAEMPTLVTQVADAAMSIFGTLVAYIPDLLSLGADMISGLVQGLVNSLGNVGGWLGESISGVFYNLFADCLPNILNSATKLIQSISAQLPAIVKDLTGVIPEILQDLTETLLDALPDIAQAGVQLFSALVSDLPAAILEIVTAIPAIVRSLCSSFQTNQKEIKAAGADLLTALVADLPHIIDEVLTAVTDILSAVLDTLIESIPTIIDTGVELLTSLISDLPGIINTITASLPEIIDNIVQKLTSLIPKIIETGVTLLVSLVKNLPAIIAGIIKVIPSLISAVITTLGSFISSFANVGKNLLLGLADGIAGAVSSVVKKAKEAAQKVLNTVKDFFGIKSPSRLFRNEIGKNLMLGLAEGIEGNTKQVSDAMDEVTRMTTGTLASKLEIGVAHGTMQMNATYSADQSGAERTQALLKSAVYVLERYLPEIANMKLELDGREVGRGLAPYLDEQFAL